MKAFFMDQLERFSNRVTDYIRYRPHYPDAVAQYVLEQKIIPAGAAIADIGSGTGFSAELFLKHGCPVVGVEPNREMREAGETYLATYPGFSSVNGTAENTTLADHSVDAVLAGQAFHWFDREQFRTECRRILKPGGNVLLLWNDRQTDTSDFLKAYEDLLLMFGTDYKTINHKNVQQDEVFDAFYGKGNWNYFSAPNFQDVNFEGLKGRLLSCSYIPTEEHPDYNFMLYVLKKIFVRYQENGLVRLAYDSKLYYGNV